MALEPLSLDIGDEEGRDEVLDQDFRFVLLLFNLVQELVDGSNLELGFVIGLERGGGVDGLQHNVLQVRVYRALVDAHQLLVEHVFSLAKDLLSLTATRFLGFTSASLVLSQLDQGGNTTLLLQTD